MQINSQISNMNVPMPNMMMQFQNNAMILPREEKIIEENPKNEYGIYKYNISFKNRFASE